MSLLPYIVDSGMVDGNFIRVLPYCQNNCSSGKCKEYYDKLNALSPGFYMCPNGLSSLVCVSNSGNRVIYSGIRAKGFYDKKKAKVAQAKENIYNPVLLPEELLSLANEDIKIQESRISLSEKEDAVKDVLHEARKLNAQIKNICDIIWDEFPGNSEDVSDEDINTLVKRLLNIHVCSYLAYNRFAYYDISTNPELSYGAPYETVIFKKFDKLRMLLKDYSRKKVWISLEDQNTYCYKVYPTFETLLFIILENAIKYSPKNKPVNVYFNETGNKLDVSVVSLGPYCESDELNCLTEKGFRGTNAKLFDNTGQGIGLPFAKKIADMHEIDLEFKSSYTTTIKGIKFGEFRVKLHFDKSRQKNY